MKRMKKLIPILLAAFTLTACEKQADLDELDGRYVVYTNHDPQTNFGNLSTYYLPDSILLIGNSEQPEYATGQQAQEILQSWADNMESRGFKRASQRNQASLGLQVSYVENSYHFTAIGWGGWGWDYPWYWGPDYWGMWGGWYYPYPVTYTYSTNTLVMEMVDLTGDSDGKNIPVLWYANASGAQYSGMYNLQLLVNSVEQAFKQSEYIQCNN